MNGKLLSPEKIMKLQKISAITAELRDIEEKIKAAKKQLNSKNSNFMQRYAAQQWIESLLPKKKELLTKLISDI